MKAEQAEQLIGERVLVSVAKSYGGHAQVDERKLLEISPSGEWVKTMDLHGRRHWEQTSGVSLVEVLSSREVKPTIALGQAK